MQVPDMIFRELTERLAPVDRPGFGKVILNVEMNYFEGQFLKANIAAYAVETIKA
jgi:hypothetical protein